MHNCRILSYDPNDVKFYQMMSRYWNLLKLWQILFLFKFHLSHFIVWVYYMHYQQTYFLATTLCPMGVLILLYISALKCKHFVLIFVKVLKDCVLSKYCIFSTSMLFLIFISCLRVPMKLFLYKREWMPVQVNFSRYLIRIIVLRFTRLYCRYDCFHLDLLRSNAVT